MTQSAQTIPAGYKQTEIGVIPVDWDVDCLGNFVTIRSGESPSKFKISKSGVPYFKVDQLNNSIKFQKETPYYIEVTNPIKANSLIFPKRGAAIYQDKIRILAQDSYMDTNLMTLTVDSKLDNEYLFYYLLKRGLSHIADTTSVPQINNKHIIPFKIIFPKSKPEQIAIATALSDTDALIENLEKLIAKKKAIKQGAMQQLLTGKKRLPGFRGEWEVKKLGEIASISTGKKDVNEGNVSGLYPFFTCSKKISYSNSYSFEGEAILIAGNGEVGHLQYYNGKFEAYQRTYVLQNFCVDVDYLWLQLSANFKKSLGIGTIGSTIPYIKKENIFDFEYSCPKDPKEQTAIATVLSDMDAEIEKLENKLSKYRQIKTGMMQQLLTGKIRLVKN